MKNHLFEAYLDFCKSKSFFDMTEKIKKWAEIIFGYSNMKVMFVDKDSLYSYERGKE